LNSSLDDIIYIADIFIPLFPVPSNSRQRPSRLMSVPCDSRLAVIEEDIRNGPTTLPTSDMVSADADHANSEEALAGALVALHEISHDQGKLEEAICLYEHILDVSSAEHTHERARALTGLGRALWRLCEFHAEDAVRLRRSIGLLREASYLCPAGHLSRSDTLYSLGLALLTGFEQLGDLDMLLEAVNLHRDALRLRPLGHPFRDDSLNGLAITLLTQFGQQGGLDILDEAIDLHRQALLLRFPGHPRRGKSLNNLAIALSASALSEAFEHHGDFDALAESTTVAREALLLCPPGNPKRHWVLHNLAYTLIKTFEHQGSEDTLGDAITLHREALLLRSAGHPERDTSLGGLAHALQMKSDHGGSTADLHEAITLHREALQLRVLAHPFRDATQFYLAVALETSYQHHHSPEVLTEAVSLHRQALAARVHSHPSRHLSLMGLASSLSRFAAESNTLDTWKETVSLYEEALALCPKGHPRRAEVSSRLGRCLLNPTAPILDFDLGVVQLLEGLSDGFAPIKERLQNAVEDLRVLETACHAGMSDVGAESQKRRQHDILRLYEQAIQLLPRIANLGMDHQTRYRTLTGSDEISRNAATRALLLGCVSQAVEMLEEGRGLFWSQALRLRTSGLDNVPEADRVELQRLFRALDDGARGLTSASTDQPPAIREQNLENQRQLNLQAEALIATIRGYSGLQRFLMPAAFDMLFQSLPTGFVIIVNASPLGIHALLLSRNRALAESLELPLSPSLTIEFSTTMGLLPRDASSQTRKRITDSRAMRISKVEPQGFEDLLAMLWATVVNPIFRKLGLQVSKASVVESQVMM
jgi:tetratricopeptide (TPR) repeat protein